MYVQQNQHLSLIECFYDVQSWDEYHLENDPPHIHQLIQYGALCLGTYTSENQLIAVTVISNQHISDYPQAKLLAYFYVDANHQGLGIGAKLIHASMNLAKQLGAKQLYISATPSKRTVDFYLKHGAEILAQPDQKLFALEPEDIHLLYALS